MRLLPQLLPSLLLLGTALAQPRVVTDEDLAPVTLGADDVRARGLIARQRWIEAAAAVTAKSPEARLAKGWLLFEAKRPAEALAALKGLETALPTVGAWTRALQAQALGSLKRFDEAAARVEDVPADTASGRIALRVRAQALREGGRIEEARGAYQEILASKRDTEVPVGLLGLARLEEEAGRAETAIALLRRLDDEYPTHWGAASGRALGERIAAARPDLKAAWEARTPEAALERAERLLDRHQNKQVVAALTPLTGLKGALACRRDYALGSAHRKLREWKTARPLLDNAVKVCAVSEHELAPWAIFLAGKAAERLADETGAAALYRLQMASHPTHRLADDAGYALVQHFIDDEKDLKAAHAELTRLVAVFPDGDMLPDAIFEVALAAIQAKDHKIARAALALDKALPPRGFRHHDSGRVEYWLAQLDQRDGRKDDAKQRYADIISTHRLSWYAILAYSRLRELDAKQARVVAKDALNLLGKGPQLPGGEPGGWRFELPEGVDHAAWDRAVLFARIGLTGPAIDALAEARLGDTDDADWIRAWVLDRAGAYNFSHDILRRRQPQFRAFAPAGPYVKHWRMAFPDPFGSLATKASKATGTPDGLVRGIIREESGFNAAIESFANAMGLMQLIMPTAKSMADKDDGVITRDTLSNPELNVRLGARYLAHVQKYTGAAWALVPAGYNAGAGALNRWVKARGDVPLDLFVELIPFDEARGYTKRVNSSWATYRVLAGELKGKDPMPYLSQKTKK